MELTDLKLGIFRFSEMFILSDFHPERESEYEHDRVCFVVMKDRHCHVIMTLFCLGCALLS